MSLLPAAYLTKLSSVFDRIPGTTRGAKGVWLWNLTAIFVIILILKGLKVPAEWTSDIHTPKPHKFSEYINMGLWIGGCIHIGISLLLLATVKWWGKAGGISVHTKLRHPRQRPAWFIPALVVIVVGALFLRLPRMGHSCWGDEGWALENSGYGQFEPKDGKDFQGELVFKPVTWARVVWDDTTGGNHFFFSVCQKITMDVWRAIKGLPPTAFDEAVSRIPLLIGGLLSLVAIAMFLNWLGRPVAGLAGALYFAMHPWHIRYSTEARGYILMILFFVLAVWTLFIALKDSRWRNWALAFVCQFLAIYSWKVAALPLVAVDVIALLWVLRPANGPLHGRLVSCSRLIVSGMTMSAFFLVMYAPCVLQSPRAMERLRHTGKPMNEIWLENSLSGLLVGAPWDRAAPDNPTETPVSEALRRSPVLVGYGLASAIGLILLGAVRISRESPSQALMWLSIVGCAAFGAALFKWVLTVEWIFWYSFFVIVPLGVIHGLGLEYLIDGIRRFWSAGRPAYVGMAALGLFAPIASFAVSVPQIRLMQTQAYESNREAFLLTRGQQEPWTFMGPSKIKTCHLWRHIDLYDPRADRYVRTADALMKCMAETDRIGGELYYVVGQRDLFANLQHDVMELLANRELFDHTHTFLAEESIHILEIYRYRRNSLTRTKDQPAPQPDTSKSR